ncbi:protein-tyrosine phosphatase-like protein [Chaetomium sp. MPI-CAGE-AT-0009]|nr:protein-tyrosine phosphatase-like protein [Chaetomium sp. MPI-CAGE-AT-0009]
MALNRINGDDELYVGGWEHNITHILSVIKYALNRDDDAFRNVEHLSIDIDDMDDQDILVHLPRFVRFIDRGLHSGKPTPDNKTPSAATITPSSDSPNPPPSGAVLVHCAMGKSRSVTAVLAYLLWKHPHRFGKADPTTTAQQAVAQALQWVRETRPVAEPNDGFMRQLEMWWDMGCPADSDDAVEQEPAYQRWLYKREVEDAARIGRAPDRIRFEDEEAPGAIRCKKCRRVLATGPFIVPHRGRGEADRADCPHFFIEALSWMRPILEEGALDGRLICPNAKCSASIGRYAWQGFKCSCGEWVAPAFSLQSSKVDKVVTRSQNTGAGAIADRMAALGIRMPPGAEKVHPAATSGASVEKCKGNL